MPNICENFYKNRDSSKIFFFFCTFPQVLRIVLYQNVTDHSTMFWNEPDLKQQSMKRGHIFKTVKIFLLLINLYIILYLYRVKYKIIHLYV